MDESAPFVISGMTTTVSIKHPEKNSLIPGLQSGSCGAPNAVIPPPRECATTVHLESR